MHLQLVGRERARQFALDELLVGGHGVERALEAHDGAGTFLRRRAQREPGAARELAARGGVARRLRKAGMRAQRHHRFDPKRARDGIERGADDRPGIDVATGSDDGRELVAADAATHRIRRQRFLEPGGHRDDEFVAAERAELRGDVGHAVQFDEREGRHVVGGAPGQREIEPLERLGVVRQAGELVFVGGAPRLFLARRQLTPRAPELRQRNPGEAHQTDGDGGDEWHQPLHRLHHRVSFLPGQESGDTALRVDHRLHFTVAGGRIDFVFEIFEADALFDHADEARVDRFGFVEQVAEFTGGVAQRGALLRPQPLVALPRQPVTDDAGKQGRAHGEHREHDDQARGRQHPFGARARRVRFYLAVHTTPPALHCGMRGQR